MIEWILNLNTEKNRKRSVQKLEYKLGKRKYFYTRELIYIEHWTYSVKSVCHTE